MELTGKDRLKGAIVSSFLFSLIGCSILGFVWGLALNKELLKIGLYLGAGLGVFFAFYFYSLFKKGGFERIKGSASGLGGIMSVLFVLLLVIGLIVWGAKKLF